MAGRKNDGDFNELYYSTYDIICKYVLSKCGSIDEVPDIMQKIYLNYYERTRKRGHAELPLQYLYKIAKSELRKYYIFKARSNRNVPVFSQNDEDGDYSAAEALLNRELPEDANLDTAEIWEYIKALDTATAQILILYFYYGETLAEIAKKLEMNESTVKSRLYRATEKMKNKFKFYNEG